MPNSYLDELRARANAGRGSREEVAPIGPAPTSPEPTRMFTPFPDGSYWEPQPASTPEDIQARVSARLNGVTPVFQFSGSIPTSQLPASWLTTSSEPAIPPNVQAQIVQERFTRLAAASRNDASIFRAIPSSLVQSNPVPVQVHDSVIYDPTIELARSDGSDEPYPTRSLEHHSAPSGCTAVAPSPTEVQIDADTPEQAGTAIKALKIMASHGFPCTLKARTKSRNGREHLILESPRPLTDLERITLQVCCGSDPIRELLSLLRVLKGITNPTILYEVELHS